MLLLPTCRADDGQKNPGRSEPATKKTKALRAGRASVAYHQQLRPAGKAAIHTPAIAAKHINGADNTAPAMAHVAVRSAE